ncbi:acyltransferase family protein [Mycolicibacterium litorale]|uniref:acyltransferase family protein n=1 Tax=Mycolicibacterium litorale TaxID=758802 RepID=UPI0039A10A2E
MTSVFERYMQTSRRRRRRAARAGKRLDIQGLRMVAVLTVFANHLWDWPRGGFVGVDVFFVISGFLITSNLLRSAEGDETGSAKKFFWKFYWGRIRRIVPAATVVLVLTCIAAALLLLPFQAKRVAVDAGWAFVFLSNWWFAAEGTDYFAADDAVSPLQHYWSLSVEEQFYFVWPALIFIISVYVARKAWTHDHRMRIAAVVMSAVIALSLGWALFETIVSPTWAYFDTFSRVWELGAGALLACSAGALTKISNRLRPWLSWGGLALIAVSVILISDDASGFPAPWAMLPIVGASLVIAAGVGREPRQAILQNPVSGYIGDISYSLYLVHWPVIVLAAYALDAGLVYNVVVLGLAFGLAVASYHFVEQPLRHFERDKLRETLRDIRKRRYTPQPASGYAAAGALSLVVLALTAYVLRPEAYEQPTAPPALAEAAADDVDPSGREVQVGPLGAALQDEIVAALKATAWPALDPPMEQVLAGPTVYEPLITCDVDAPAPDPARCTWGEPTATTRLVLAGDSEATTYAGPLREMALASGGRLQVTNLSMTSCTFTAELIDKSITRENCDARKRHVVETINTTKPNVVVIANLYRLGRTGGSDRQMSPVAWADSMRRIIKEFRPNAGRVVLLSGPPSEVNIEECFGKRGNVPADCVGRVTKQWTDMAIVERKLAEEVGGVWIDARPWFCSSGQLCPAFVGTTATKIDEFHFAPAYGQKIASVIAESFEAAGVPLR